MLTAPGEGPQLSAPGPGPAPEDLVSSGKRQGEGAQGGRWDRGPHSH